MIRYDLMPLEWAILDYEVEGHPLICDDDSKHVFEGEEDE